MATQLIGIGDYDPMDREPRRVIRSKPPETPPKILNHRGEEIESVPAYEPGRIYGSTSFWPHTFGSLPMYFSGHYLQSDYEERMRRADAARRERLLALKEYDKAVIKDVYGVPVRSERVVPIPVPPVKPDADAQSGQFGGAGDGTAVTRRLGR